MASGRDVLGPIGLEKKKKEERRIKEKQRKHDGREQLFGLDRSKEIFLDKFYKLTEIQARKIIANQRKDEIPEDIKLLIKFKIENDLLYEQITGIIEKYFKENILSKLLRVEYTDCFERFTIYFERFTILQPRYDNLMNFRKWLQDSTFIQNKIKKDEHRLTYTELLSLNDNTVLKTISRYIPPDQPSDIIKIIQNQLFASIIGNKLDIYREIFNTYGTKKIMFLSSSTHIITYIVDLDSMSVDIFDPAYNTNETEKFYNMIKLLINYSGIDPDTLKYNIIPFNVQEASDKDDSADIFCKAWCYYYIYKRIIEGKTQEEFKHFIQETDKENLQIIIKTFLYDFIKTDETGLLDVIINLIKKYEREGFYLDGGYKKRILKYKFVNINL